MTDPHDAAAMPDSRDQLRKSGRRPLWLWALVFVLFILTAWLQHRAEPVTSSAAAQTNIAATSSGPDLLRVISQIAVAMKDHLGTAKGQIIKELDHAGPLPVDAFRRAIVLDELGYPEEAEQNLVTARVLLAKTDVEPDIEAYKKLREEGAAPLTTEQRQGLADRHGWFADLALTRELPETDPARLAVRDKGFTVFLGLMFLMVCGGLAMLAGIALLVIAIVKYSSGELRAARPLAWLDRTVILEMIAVFFLGFVLVKFVGEWVVSSMGGSRSLVMMLGLQWSLALVIFWPVVRGVPWKEAREALGLHKGKGVFREIGCGVMGYFAGLPVMIAAAMVALAVSALWQFLMHLREAMKQGVDPRLLPSEPPPAMDPASNPIIQAVGSADPLTLMLLASLIVIWAPLVEETIFRGALFGELRRWVRWPLAAIFTGFVFASVHAYPPLVMVPVSVLGFNFCLLRAWRGSLIAPMTAHFMQNATALTFMILIFKS